MIDSFVDYGVVAFFIGSNEGNRFEIPDALLYGG
jgi:hypothetical protein